MIVVPDDDLRTLGKHFGPDVRQMGTWNSDGVFGFCAVPLSVVEKITEEIGHPILAEAVQGLKKAENRTKPFVQIVREFGPSLVEKIAASYREHLADSYGLRTPSASGAV